MLGHAFLTVSKMKRSVWFYEAVLAALGTNQRFDFDGKNGPPGHPDLKGFGANGRLFLWLREGVADRRAAHLGFVLYATKRVRIRCRTGMMEFGAAESLSPLGIVPSLQDKSILYRMRAVPKSNNGEEHEHRAD